MRRESLNTTAVTAAVNNSSFERSNLSDLVLPKLDEKMLKDLQFKRDKLEERIEAKNSEKDRAVNGFVAQLEKELAALKAQDYKKEEEAKKDIAKFG